MDAARVRLAFFFFAKASSSSSRSSRARPARKERARKRSKKEKREREERKRREKKHNFFPTSLAPPSRKEKKTPTPRPPPPSFFTHALSPSLSRRRPPTPTHPTHPHTVVHRAQHAVGRGERPVLGLVHAAGRRRPEEDESGLGSADQGARVLEVAAVGGQVRERARSWDQDAQEEDDRRGVRRSLASSRFSLFRFHL